VSRSPLERLLRGHVAGEVPPQVTLLRALLTGASPEAIRDALDAPAPRGTGARPRRRRAELRRTLRAHWTGCLELAAMLRAGDALGPRRDGVEGCAALFDAYARRSEAGAVAGYSLGSPRLLAAATAETVALLERLGVLGPGRRILQIGCGTGRFEAALAPRVGLAHGIDIAPTMVARARARCAGLPNVRVSACSGRDLAPFGDASLDLVYAVDSFPYIHQAGLAAHHVAEAARVLRPGGDLVIVNFAYGRSLSADRREVSGLARRFGFRVRVNGAAPFRLWDARVFHLRRRSARAAASPEDRRSVAAPPRAPARRAGSGTCLARQVQGRATRPTGRITMARKSSKPKRRGSDTESTSAPPSDTERSPGIESAQAGPTGVDEQALRGEGEEEMAEEVSTISADSPEDEDGFAIGDEEIAERASGETGTRERGR
jgi:SAM-dependent methyltransferase